MGMLLEYELTARYAAGSLGGTLGRLNDSLRRLTRARGTGSREKPGESEEWPIDPARFARLNQALRLMEDAWRSRRTGSRRFSNITDALDKLKEKTMARLCKNQGSKMGGGGKYQLLAQTMDKLARASPGQGCRPGSPGASRLSGYHA